MKIFWKFTIKLGESAAKLLYDMLKNIVLNKRKYLKIQQSKKSNRNNNHNIFQLIEFRQKLLSLIQKCFQKQRKIINLIYNTFQQLFYQQQKSYLTISIDNILNYYYLSNKDQININNTIPQQKTQYNLISPSPSRQYFHRLFNLFRLCPSKQNFIHQYQNKLTSYIITNGFNIDKKQDEMKLKNTFKLQYQFICEMKKQVGINLVKKVQKMLYDVWRQNDHIHEINEDKYYVNYYYYTNNSTILKCLLLSSQHPLQLSLVFNLPDQLYFLQQLFQSSYKSSSSNIENTKKQLTWLNELGNIKMKINGIESVFSTIEACVILLLDKAIRPLRMEQIDASINVKMINVGEKQQEKCAKHNSNNFNNTNNTNKNNKKQHSSSQHPQPNPQNNNFNSQQHITTILNHLVSHNILTFNPNSLTFDINDQNTQPYINPQLSSPTQYQPSSSLKNSSVSSLQKDYNILIQACIIKILKRRKSMQRNDITKNIQEKIKYFKPTFEQITKAFENLESREFLTINRNKGVITYIQ